VTLITGWPPSNVRNALLGCPPPSKSGCGFETLMSILGSLTVVSTSTSSVIGFEEA